MIFDTVYNSLKRFVYEVDQLTRFSFKMVLSVFGRPIYLAETMEQMYLIGIGSLFLVTLTGIFAGQAMALQFANQLSEFGSKNYLGRVMAIAIVREVAARVAAGITAEIGTMKSSNQLDAMVAFGIDPIRKLAAPRLLALVVMVPVLTITCDAIAIIGGWIIALFMANITTSTYISGINAKLTFGNIFMGILKPFCFAFVIAFISCYKGFTTAGGTKGVGRSTNESVVIASITILIVNFILTKLVWTFLKGYL